MHCKGYDHLYMVASGEFRCWCQSGENVVLGRHGEGFDVVRDLVNGKPYADLRQSFAEGMQPFAECSNCERFEPNQDGSELMSATAQNSWTVRHLDVFQVETSYLCNLDCPLCVPRVQRRSLREAPFSLTLQSFRRVIDDLVRHQISVGTLHFCGRGEPLINPHALEMIRYAKDRIDCQTMITTHGNHRPRPEFVSCGLDRIEICLDGDTQENYEKYRRDGKLESVLRFAKGLALEKRSQDAANPLLVFKHILFRFNDSDESLARTLQHCEECGIDELMIVYTDTPFRSHRFTIPEEFMAAVRRITGRTQFPFEFHHESYVGTLPDRILSCVESPSDSQETTGALAVSGWAFDTQEQVDRIELSINGVSTLSAAPRIERRDVVEFYGLNGIIDGVDNCGFLFELETELQPGGNEIEIFAISTDKTRTRLAKRQVNRIPE